MNTKNKIMKKLKTTSRQKWEWKLIKYPWMKDIYDDSPCKNMTIIYGSSSIPKTELIMTIKKGRHIMEFEDWWNSTNIQHNGNYKVVAESAWNAARQNVKKQNDEIIPCPFCGSKPYIDKDDYGEWGIYCSNPNCEAEIFGKSEKEVKTKWNKRREK